MARNATVVLSGDNLDRSTFYAGIVSDALFTLDTVEFRYTSRTGEVATRAADVLEIVGTPGTSSHGFKGMTDQGPRTFNFHLMG